jgi:hypothetical protein
MSSIGMEAWLSPLYEKFCCQKESIIADIETVGLPVPAWRNGVGVGEEPF